MASREESAASIPTSNCCSSVDVRSLAARITRFLVKCSLAAPHSARVAMDTPIAHRNSCYFAASPTPATPRWALDTVVPGTRFVDTFRDVLALPYRQCRRAEGRRHQAENHTHHKAQCNSDLCRRRRKVAGWDGQIRLVDLVDLYIRDLFIVRSTRRENNRRGNRL